MKRILRTLRNPGRLLEASQISRVFFNFVSCVTQWMERMIVKEWVGSVTSTCLLRLRRIIRSGDWRHRALKNNEFRTKSSAIMSHDKPNHSQSYRASRVDYIVLHKVVLVFWCYTYNWSLFDWYCSATNQRKSLRRCVCFSIAHVSMNTGCLRDRKGKSFTDSLYSLHPLKNLYPLFVAGYVTKPTAPCGREWYLSCNR